MDFSYTILIPLIPLAVFLLAGDQLQKHKAFGIGLDRVFRPFCHPGTVLLYSLSVFLCGGKSR